MCELRGNDNAIVAAGRQRQLFVQRLRTLPQSKRTKQTTHQTQEKTGKILIIINLTIIN